MAYQRPRNETIYIGYLIKQINLTILWINTTQNDLEIIGYSEVCISNPVLNDKVSYPEKDLRVAVIEAFTRLISIGSCSVKYNAGTKY